MKPVSLLTDILLSIAEATQPLTRVKAKLCGFNVSFIKRRRWWLKRFNYFRNKATRSCSDFAPSKFVRTTAFASWWSLDCFQPQSRFWPPHVKTCLDFNRCDAKAGSCSSFLPKALFPFARCDAMRCDTTGSRIRRECFHYCDGSDANEYTKFEYNFCTHSKAACKRLW